MLSTKQIQAIRQALSTSRMSTYERATSWKGLDDESALALYAWNAQISSALLVPLHICEVVIRNSVSEVLEAVYGPRWPWDATFERSLPSPSGTYSEQRDLRSARDRLSTTGKVIPELKFVFWQKMFTSRHDVRLWRPHIHTALPNHAAGASTSNIRTTVYNDLEEIRKLRNRIAHHEPIFARNVASDMDRIEQLIHLRSSESASWMASTEQVRALLKAKPK